MQDGPTAGVAQAAGGETPIRQTPLHALHARLGAKVVPFAGYAMPLHYPAGLLKEHLHTRAEAGLFDVSHMGQIALSARSGGYPALARALEALIPIDLVDLAPGRQRYGFLTNAEGGILDDLMAARIDDRIVLVVNTANKAADEAHLRARLPDDVSVAVIPNALIALQGPRAEEAFRPLLPEAAAMRFMDVREAEILGAPCMVTRSGYSGEDGFEVSVPADRAEALAEALLAEAPVSPVGLGARDSLRLEAGLCLHGADIDPGTSPIEAALSWAIPPVRRRGGAREGGFPGAQRILDQAVAGPARRRVGLAPQGRMPVRAGATLYASDDDDDPIGAVTSGGFGPSLQAPVAMGYLPAGLAEPGTRVAAQVRGQRVPVTVTRLPFVPARFKRG